MKSNLNSAPNHTLQRTAPCVTAPASAAALPSTLQVPSHTPWSLGLGRSSEGNFEGLHTAVFIPQVAVSFHAERTTVLMTKPT